jgi:hypothetical protein
MNAKTKEIVSLLIDLTEKGRIKWRPEADKKCSCVSYTKDDIRVYVSRSNGFLPHSYKISIRKFALDAMDEYTLYRSAYDIMTEHASAPENGVPEASPEKYNLFKNLYSLASAEAEKCLNKSIDDVNNTLKRLANKKKGWFNN